MTMKTIKSSVLLIMFGFCSAGMMGQTMDEIITKHIAAIGGKENWSKLKTLKMEGTIKAQGAEIKITIFQVDKKAMRQNIALMGMTGYSIVTNTEGWNFMPFQGQTKPEPITVDDLKNAQDELYLQDDFITYTELGKKIEYLGKDDFDGTECFKFKMTDKNGQETTYYIDASNYYTLKETSKVKANGQEQENSTVFGDYKMLAEGFLYPMSVSSSFGEMQVTKLDVNPVIDEGTFKLPK